MTQEEKARAYDEALKKIQPLYEQAKKDDNPIWSAYEYLFPQLRESEDERVIKALETFINLPEIAEKITFEARIMWLSWLEKQKEQNGEDEECTDFTIYHPLKNGKGKYECIPYNFYGSLTSFSKDKDLIDFLRTCFYTKEECNEWIKQQKEQKPVLTAKEAWKEMRLEVYAQASGNRHEPNYSDDSTKMFSLCDIDEIFEKIGNSTVEQKPAWSEEDEKMRNLAIEWAETMSGQISFVDMDSTDFRKIIAWLKSLRPQPSWKPSEEQIKAIESCFCEFGEGCPDEDGLRSLYNDLKKLM